MSVRDTHIPMDRLTALAMLARAPESAQDRDALSHVACCDACATALERLTTESDSLRDAAFAEADAVFDDARVEAQRSRILDRLAHVGQVARVLPFPTRTREASMPVPSGSRRWVSVAAAAGLIIGLLAGQLVHLVPWDPRTSRDQSVSMQSARPSPVILPASNGNRALTDDELLDEIEAAVQLRRASSLRALDAITPTASDLSLGR